MPRVDMLIRDLIDSVDEAERKYLVNELVEKWKYLSLSVNDVDWKNLNF